MATGGWGAVGGGAWGGAPSSKNYEENIPEAPRPAPPTASSFGQSAFSAQPAQQPELATTSYRSQPANTGGFGSSAGAYGTAAAGGQPSFNTASSMTDPALRRKEAELAAKEKQLKELEAKLSAAGALEKKNWPICYPILYHNISEEIPEGRRRPVYEGYMAWWGLFICLAWNLFCACVMLGQDVNQKVPSWFLALLYIICGVPLSWWLWYKRLYNGAKSDSTFGFVWFFLWFLVHTAYCTWAAIAMPFSASQWSFAGFITAMKALDVNNFAGIIYLVGAGCWSVEAAFSWWILVDVWLYFRGKGGIKEVKEAAKREAALAAFRSQSGTNV
ncbi:hypothetical protein Agub_g710 [Astrephomene gubernaculifera]|uniref:Secretory carrier-associated membrane protein n=1 Tax=Astrephomene gubernaculifera TaxID=47775 RepID=A0AAD3DE48_9CHLO|nr:hypothetical protein Agub_g710 [Astrephomene gubernaculifera]